MLVVVVVLLFLVLVQGLTNSLDMDVVDMNNILIILSDSVLWEKTMEASYLVGSFPCQFD